MRPFLLHMILPESADLQPKAPFYPEILLEPNSSKTALWDEIAGHAPWGGWVARFQDSLTELPGDSLQVLLVLPPDPDQELSPNPRFFQAGKQRLILARRNLMALGATEILTGNLLVRSSRLPEVTIPRNQDEWQSELQTLGFKHWLCLLSPEDPTPIPPEFSPIVVPAQVYQNPTEWIQTALLTATHFSFD